MNYNKLTLEFKDKYLEREFKEHNDFSNRAYLRTGCIISLIMWIVVNIFTRTLYPENFANIFLITLSVILPLLLYIFIITLLENYKTFYQWSTGLVNFLIAVIHLSLSFYYFKSQTYTTSVMIIMALYVFFIFRLRFKIALIVTVSFTLTYQFMMFVYLAQYTPEQIIINTGILWGAFVANISGGCFLEKATRILFMNNRLLGEQRDEIEEANRKLVTTSTELAQAHNRLKELDRIKTDFFSNISHEIRTPLTLIMTPVESAIRGEYGKPVDKIFLENIQKNSVRLLGLINDLLDFSKIEAGKMSIRVREIDIVNFIKTLLGTIESAAKTKGVDLAITADVPELGLFIDSDKTEKIMINILSNALKFTRKGDSIRVCVGHESNDCIIEVKDTGEGIPGDKINFIFDRFSQVNTSSKRKFEGAGIGLALAKELVEMQGGSISVESRFIGEYPDSHGTIFRIKIPKGRDHLENMDNVEFIQDAPPVTVDKNKYHELDNKSGRKNDTVTTMPDKEHTVLIVEDNDDMVNLLTDLLTEQYNVVSATNGREGLDLLMSGKHEIDLVLADVMMPIMDGYEMTGEIRKNSRYEGLPILLLTAKADVSMKVEGIERGATDYITKPFDARELNARIKAQLEMKVLRDRLKKSNEKLYNQLKKKKDTTGGVSDLSEEKVKIIIEFINDNYDTDISREGLASAVDINPDHLSRVFNRYTGKKINEYINAIRIEEAKKKLENSSYNITEIAISVGFENLRTFNRHFLSTTGVSPTEYRAQTFGHK